MSKILVTVNAKVSAAGIRRETHNNREHFVVPSYTLPSNVIMNGGLYPASEIDAHYQKLEGTLAPLGHPVVNGKNVSAFSPEALNVNHIGAWNRNVKKAGNRIYAEKWIDIETAKLTANGKRLVERLEAIERGEQAEPIHTSVALFLERQPAVNAQGYDWIAKIDSIDHDAILLDSPGAATPEQGVGMMVNADQAVPLQANQGALIGESYREREQRLDQAAKSQLSGQGEEDYAYVLDFTDSQAVIRRSGQSSPELFGYKIEAGKIVFDGQGQPVTRQESWAIMATNAVKKLLGFNQDQARPDSKKGGDMPLTSEEKAELTKDISAAITANVSKAIADSIKPLAEKVDTLQANQSQLSETLTANHRAEEAKKREVVKAKFGEIVANSLTGDALEQMYQQCQGAAPLLAGNAASGKDGDLQFGSIDDHFGLKGGK